MTGTTTPPATRFALYCRPDTRRGRWTLLDTFDSERAAWDRVRGLPFRHLAYWITAVPAGETSTELTPAGLKNLKTGTAVGTKTLFDD